MTEPCLERKLKEHGIGVTPKGMRQACNLARTISAEVFRATNAGLDWLDELHRSVFTAVRNGVQALATLTQRTLDRLASGTEGNATGTAAHPSGDEPPATRAA